MSVAVRVIPCLDVDAGRVVKGVNFENLRDAGDPVEQVRALTIHHSAGTNDYTRAQAVEQMRAIYAYYTKTLDWGDFPYHLITDRFGNIYEGRRGALDANPLGTHAGGFNTGTMGISTMGNYDVVAPSEEVVDAMANVPTGPNDKPIDPVVIESVEIVD